MAIYWTQFNKGHKGLASNFKVNPNSCGNSEHFHRYLNFCAITDQKIGKGVTYILVNEEECNKKKDIIGFITLKAASLVMISDNHMEGYPAVEISELAVDLNFERKGFGTDLVNYVIKIANKLRNEIIGVEYIVTCSEPLSVPFYIKNNFYKLENYFDIPFDIPREGWNVDCIPMAFKLPEN